MVSYSETITCDSYNCGEAAVGVALLDTIEGKKNRTVCERHANGMERWDCFVKWLDAPTELKEYALEGQ